MEKVRKNHDSDKICVMPNTTKNVPDGCEVVLVNVGSLTNKDFFYQENKENKEREKLKGAKNELQFSKIQEEINK